METELHTLYQKACTNYSDIHEHIPVLKNLAEECSSTIEIGVRSMVSTWGILQGLAENNHLDKSYLGIDIALPPLNTLATAERLAHQNGIAFQFWQVNDMHIEIEETDLLFIDSLHTYCHLTYELEKFSPFVTKYIAMHDTSFPWSYMDDDSYRGDYSEYPTWYDRTKRGLWPAVEDFLKRHPEWTLHKRLLNNHGFTILRRVKEF